MIYCALEIMMPRSKTEKYMTRSTKKKLSPAERSQVAKDRWAKIREAKESKPDIVVTWPDSTHPLDGLLSSAVANAPEGEDRIDIVTEQGTVIASADIPTPTTFNGFPVYPLAPQLAPVAPKRQKRYTGPKEFSVALKAAESRLAKAIVERAEASGKLAMLQAEIPSLLQIIAALKGQQTIPVAPYDFSNAQGFPPFASAGIPYQMPTLDLGAIQTAMAAPPASRAVGNAIQFSPDVVGSLEGPDDDNPDRFLEGPHAGGGWIGG